MRLYLLLLLVTVASSKWVPPIITRPLKNPHNATALVIEAEMLPPPSNIGDDAKGHRIPKARCVLRADRRPLVSHVYTDIWGAGWDPYYLHGKHGKGKRYKSLMKRLKKCGGYGISIHYRVETLKDEPEGWQFHVMGTTYAMQQKCIQEAMFASGAPPGEASLCVQGPSVECEPATGRCQPSSWLGDGINHADRVKMDEALDKEEEEKAQVEQVEALKMKQDRKHG